MFYTCTRRINKLSETQTNKGNNSIDKERYL